LGKLTRTPITCGPVLTEASHLLVERRGIEVVFTLDRRDFSIYRLGSGKPLRLLPD
jgi:hypothetical protein